MSKDVRIPTLRSPDLKGEQKSISHPNVDILIDAQSKQDVY